ncbi:MAG: siderophore ABC transporter substrate-binding protein [Clostridiaceae bacterium]|nr:siderophore ABC transporter substrate-binding protein [Clostridiaceae bacterium]
MKKFFMVLTVMLLTLVVLTGCGYLFNPPEDANDGDDNENTQIKVVHNKGEFTLNKAAKKVVVFDMGALDTIDALGAEVELGVPTSSIPNSLSKYKNAKDMGTLFEPDLEAIFNFEPDVIIIGTRQQDYYEQLSEIAPTMFVDLRPEAFMEDFRNNTKNIASMLGLSNKAEEILNEIDAKIEDLKSMADNSDKKALILLTNDGNISVYGRGSRFGLIHDVLNIKTADSTIEASTHGQSASFEYIAQVNPDIIFVVDRTVVVGGTVNASDTLNNDLVKSTNAAKNNLIVYLDPDAWYLASGGLNTMAVMLNDVEKAFE